MYKACSNQLVHVQYHLRCWILRYGVGIGSNSGYLGILVKINCAFWFFSGEEVLQGLEG